MKTTTKKSLQKVTAVLLSALIVLSAFAMMPADLFTASAALDENWFGNRLELDFNNNWKFYLGNDSSAALKAYDDSSWETVELPHDFSISQEFFADDTVEGESGNLPGGTGWYRKTFVMSTDARDQAVYLNFDGAYKDTYVYVNGTYVGENHYGYNSFSFDISDYLVCNGETANIIAVKVVHDLPSSRWYSGSGIYRDVTLTIVDPVHVDLYGTHTTTPNLKDSGGTDGTVNASVTLVNANNQAGYTETVTVEAQILDASGSVVGTSDTETDVEVSTEQETVIELTPVLENPSLWNSWDMGDPNLYTLRVNIYKEGTLVDTYDTDFGYRWFEWNADTGFSLNGNNLKIEGVCMHHDQGALGSVQEYDAIYRQVMILKDMGSNAIRTSHGTPSDVFMDICNEVGMLVMDEFFDGWDTAKNGNSQDFSLYFDETIDTSTNTIMGAEDDMMWYEFVVTQSVKRDRNDPAVVIWDVGNELSEGASNGDFENIASNMRTIIKGLDDTRPICQGNNAPSDTGTNSRGAVDEYMDVIGGNYNTSSWISLMEGTSDSRAEKPYVGTETASAITSRGVYDTLSYYSYYCTSYDTNCVSWGDTAADIWYNTITRDWNSGEFVWTGFDYIGEPTPWNAPYGTSSSGAPSTSYFGIVDTAGFGKDTYYLYRSMWNEHSTTLHLVPGTWESSELTLNSGYAYVAVYSNAAKIELLDSNGNVLAYATSTTTETAAGHSYQTWTETSESSYVNTTEFYTGDGNDLYPQFQVNQSAFDGLAVRAYDADGNDITDSAVGTKATGSTATKITAKAWTYSGFTADGDSFPYIEFTAVDANGNVDTTYNGTLTITLSGDEAVVVGVDNGDQSTTDKFQQSSVLTSDTTVTIQMYAGKAIAVLRSTEEAGDIEVTATSDDGLSVTGVTVAINAEADAELEDEFEEIVDQPENLVYEPTIYDEYEILKSEILGDGSSSLEADYYLYSAYPDGTTVVNTDIPDGWYIITGSGSAASGALTHTAYTAGGSDGFLSDGSSGAPDAASDTWYFEKVSSGMYNIYYEDSNGDKQYLTISNNQVYVSTSAYPLSVTTDTAGNVTIGFGSTYLNYSDSNSQQVYWSSTATTLKLYYADENATGGGVTTTSYELGSAISSSDVSSLSGAYVITGYDGYTGTYAYGAMTHTQGSGGLLPTNSSTITADDTTVWYFEAVTGGYYIYYTDSNGAKQYLNIADGNITTSTTAAVLTVSDADSDGMITIGDSTNSYQLNYYGSSQLVGEWSEGTELTVYKVNVTTTTTYPTTTTVTQVTSFTTLDGDYIITGQDDYTGTYAYGAMTHDATSDGAGFLPANVTFSADDEVDYNQVWTIEPATDGYYVYYTDDSGVKQYITMNSSGATLTTTATVLTIDGTSTVTIGASDNNYKLNYFGSGQKVGVWTTGTSLTLYKVETVSTAAEGVSLWIPTASTEVASPVENGEYVIYNSSYIAGGTQVSNSAGTYTGLERVAETPSSNIITTLRSDAYTFTLVDGTTNQYYITNSEGKYITMGSGNGTVTLSDTATALYVYGTSDNRVVIYSGSYNFDNFQDANNMFSCWSGSYTSAGSNQIMTLYKNESSSTADIPAEKTELYEALVAAVEHAPGMYTTDSYATFFAALEDAYAVLLDEDATTDEIEAATLTLNTAASNLEVEYKYIPSSLWKYGYYPNNTDKYDGGGADFNELTYASTKAMLQADADLYAQIEASVETDADGNAITYASDEDKAAAVELALDAYAQIYSLAFCNTSVTSGTNVGDYAKTKWNAWCKTDTQGAAESGEEGASVQGLFSALLDENGNPTNHADYDTLTYGNHTSRTAFDTYNNPITVTVTPDSTDTATTSTVELPALDNISVNINDMFGKSDIYVNGTDDSEGYARKYYDYSFPLLVTTNEYGINTYVYSSSETSYVLQSTFDDDNNTASGVLTPVDEWSINLDGKGTGNGFFPFNYQDGATSYTGENAIYHYAFNYDMEFYIPMTGTYADAEDVVFSFSGDDDVLVYIDDVLVLDNGGLHGARTAEINFTDASISYQFAMDVTDDTIENTTENATVYTYGQTADDGLNGDELAALEKLNEVRTDGDYHTFSFYFIERGSTDSNCEISYNLQQSSEHVVLYDQTYVVDYGLPVEEIDTNSDDYISNDAVAAGTTIEILGVKDGNTAVTSLVNFDDVDGENLSLFASDDDGVIDVTNMQYGDCTFSSTGMVSYTPNTIRMTGEDYFYFCSEITNDPTYAEGTIYYQFEKVGFIPATSVYYEDNFGDDIKFTDGTVTTGSGHGVWETVGDETAFDNVKQAADLVDDDNANPYGFDPAYEGTDTSKNYTEYSGFSAKKVTVSADNLPKNGGTCPTIEFTFTGTGFDVISVTDNTTGALYMQIFDENGNQVGKRNVVDTYYGYSYGQLYADADGEETLEVTDIPLYKSADNEALTREKTYYTTNDAGETVIVRTESYLDASGLGYTDTPTYYDEDGNLTTTETENVAYAYAYAYGWVQSSESEGLYQIPVIKKTGLDYGTYTVVLTPMYTALFDNTGAGQFDLYFDAIRIYDPAGTGDSLDSAILTEYKYDNESYPSYLELKDMLIGADYLSVDSSTQGIVFIDGIAALDNDLEKLKLAGPNNELYLAQGQAVAFEIWATAVPDEVQIGMKSANGAPEFKVTYEGSSADKTLNTATEMNYIINNILPDDSKLTWSEVEVDGETYYRTETVVIQNTSDDESILAITTLKWTFTGVGQYGRYEANATETAAVMSVMSSEATVSTAYTAIASGDAEEEIVPDDNDDAGTEIIPGDDEETNDTNDEYQEELTWIQKIIRAITSFFKKIFGLA